MKANVRKDLSGMKFGRWTVLYQAEDRIRPCGKHTTMWHCVCDCGNEKDVSDGSLKNGDSTSCGCVLKEMLISKNAKKNTYDMNGDYGICYFNNGGHFIFDKDDYDVLSKYTWSNRKGYAVSGERVNGKRRNVILHRLLLGLSDGDGLEVDHINGNPGDNRKSNLRAVKHIDNMKNRKLSSRNKSGYAGVRHVDRWVASINADGKSIFLGIFDNKDDAVKARREAEEKYFGEMRRQNEG